jgi:hypothetical protein
MKIEVSFDLGERTAVVSGRYTEKYARKLLQDKLKAETPFAGGWECWLTNRARMDLDHYKLTGEIRYHEQEDYIFELSNPFASMAGYI